MAFKEVHDLDCDTTTALGGVNRTTGKPNPTKMEGYFIGSKQTPSKKSKSGIALLHIIQTERGNVGVWGKTDLDRKIAAATVGCMIRITQSGKVATPNGDMYKFKVEIDTENTIEVNFPKAAAPAEAAEEETCDAGETGGSPAYDDEVVEEDLFEEAPAVDVVLPSRPVARQAAAVAPSAAAQAKVQALLQKRRPAPPVK